MAAQLVDSKLAGHYLGFSQLKLHTIQVSEEQRRVALLEKWAEVEGEKVTYFKLAEALFEYGRRDLVEHLCKMIRRVLRSDAQSKTPPKSRRKSKNDVPLPLTSDQVCFKYITIHMHIQKVKKVTRSSLRKILGASYNCVRIHKNCDVHTLEL